jgi:hypothetical protein
MVCTLVRACTALMLAVSASATAMPDGKDIASATTRTDDPNCPSNCHTNRGICGKDSCPTGMRSITVSSRGCCAFDRGSCKCCCPPPPPPPPPHPPPPPPVCTPVMNVSAQWVALESIGVPTLVSVTKGTHHSYSYSHSEKWGNSASRSVGGGFSFGGVGAKVQVSGTTSHQVATTYNETFQTDKTTTVKQQFQPGEVWQFQFTTVDKCGNSTVYIGEVTETPNIPEPPCCLPGYFQDPSKPHGACVAGTDGHLFNLCGNSTEGF